MKNLRVIFVTEAGELLASFDNVEAIIVPRIGEEVIAPTDLRPEGRGVMYPAGSVLVVKNLRHHFSGGMPARVQMVEIVIARDGRY